MTFKTFVRTLIASGSCRFDHEDEPRDLRLRKKLTRFVNQNRRSYEIVVDSAYALQVRRK